MDRQLIQDLIDALTASGLSELEYSQNGSTLRLVRGTAAPGSAPSARPPASAPVPAPDPVPRPPSASELRAPSYGVVHLARSPGAPPMAAPGRRVTAGDTLCLIEAMKVFTPLCAEADAAVEAVLVGDGQEVDAGQALFRLVP